MMITRLPGFVFFALITLAASAQGVAPPTERLLHAADPRTISPMAGILAKRVVADTIWVGMVTVEAGKSSPNHNHPDKQVMLFHG